MTTEAIIDQLHKNREAFKALLSGKTAEEYTWRPEPGKWNLLEIVCHLVDEECEDFRARVQHTLENPDAAMKPVTPIPWVSERNYAAQNYNQMLHSFLSERSQSVAWLNTLHNVNWDSAYQHRKLGPMSARLFLVNWLAHDHLHIRQIIRYNYHYLKEKTAIDLQYAGSW